MGCWKLRVSERIDLIGRRMSAQTWSKHRMAQESSAPEQQHSDSPQSGRFKSVNELCRIPKKNPATVNGLCTISCVLYTAQPTSKELVPVTNPSSILSTLSQIRCFKRWADARRLIQTKPFFTSQWNNRLMKIEVTQGHLRLVPVWFLSLVLWGRKRTLGEVPV